MKDLKSEFEAVLNVSPEEVQKKWIKLWKNKFLQDQNKKNALFNN